MGAPAPGTAADTAAPGPVEVVGRPFHDAQTGTWLIALGANHYRMATRREVAQALSGQVARGGTIDRVTDDQRGK